VTSFERLRGYFFLPRSITKYVTKYHKENDNMEVEKVFKTVLDCSFKVHTALGPGLLESAYEECLYYELVQCGLEVKKQKALPLVYKEVKLDAGYRVDLMVENKVIVEIKSVESLADIHMAQLLTYLKLSGCKLGLLVNFNVKHLKNGIKRVIS
jgi:GxxExxY protein